MCITFAKIRDILYNNFSFHFDQIQLETKLELELGMDSREMLEFFHELEKTFKIEISFDDIDILTENKNGLSIGNIVQYLDIRISTPSFK